MISAIQTWSFDACRFVLLLSETAQKNRCIMEGHYMKTAGDVKAEIVERLRQLLRESSTSSPLLLVSAETVEALNLLLNLVRQAFPNDLWTQSFYLITSEDFYRDIQKFEAVVALVFERRRSNMRLALQKEIEQWTVDQCLYFLGTSKKSQDKAVRLGDATEAREAALDRLKVFIEQGNDPQERIGHLINDCITLLGLQGTVGVLDPKHFSEFISELCRKLTSSDDNNDDDTEEDSEENIQYPVRGVRIDVEPCDIFIPECLLLPEHANHNNKRKEEKMKGKTS